MHGGTGAVPVGAWFAQGQDGVTNAPMAEGSGQHAAWASTLTDSYVRPVRCTAHTKSGGPCRGKPMDDTELCGAHWRTVMSMVEDAE